MTNISIILIFFMLNDNLPSTFYIKMSYQSNIQTSYFYDVLDFGEAQNVSVNLMGRVGFEPT